MLVSGFNCHDFNHELFTIKFNFCAALRHFSAPRESGRNEVRAIGPKREFYVASRETLNSVFDMPSSTQSLLEKPRVA